jgi:quercetin dioxygenase-like cupin family protein
VAASGDIIDNPLLGERVIFRTTTEESAGELLHFDFVLSEGAGQPVSHRHMEQESRFKIMAGQLGARIGAGRPRIFRPGETLIVPAGTEHVIWNAHPGETQASVEIEPAGNFEQFLETVFGLMRDGRLRGGWPIPRPYLQSALLASANDLYLSGISVLLQRPGIWLMSRWAKRRGYRLSYPEYETQPNSQRRPGHSAA